MKLMIFVLATITLTSSVAWTQPVDEVIGNSEYLILFPDLRESVVPDVVDIGARVTYDAISGGGGTGGGGIIQYDVVAVGNTMVLNQVNYSNLGAGLAPLGQTPAFGIAGVGPVWVHPMVLDDAESVAGEGLTVTRLTKDVAGSQREVVRFETTTLNGSRIVDEFSTESGLMVFSSEGTTSAGSQMLLRSARRIRTPWIPDKAPNWARPGAQLVYAGTKTTLIANGNPVDQVVEVQVDVTNASRDWTTFESATSIGGIAAGVAPSVTGVGQLTGGFWLPKSALEVQIPTEPTVIDTDPDTGALLSIVGDATTISLQQELPGAVVTSTYSRELGVLIGQRVITAGPAANEDTQIQLTGGSDLATLNEEPELPFNNVNLNSTNVNANNTNPQNNGDPQNPGDAGGSKGKSDGGCATTRSLVPADGWFLFLIAFVAYRKRERLTV